MQNDLSKPFRLQQSMSIRKSKPQKNNLGSAIWAGLGALVIVIPVVAIGLTIIIFQIFELNLPGVTVFDKDVGLMTREQTTEWADYIWNESKQIELSLANSSEFQYLLLPQQLGFWVDPEATAQSAYQIGRSSSPFATIAQILKKQSITVMPVLYFNPEIAAQTLQEINDEIYVAPVNARIAFENNQWIAIPGEEGTALNIEGTQQILFENAFTVFISGEANLLLKTVPPEIDDVSAVLEKIDSAASQELTMEAYDPILDETLVWSVPKDVKLSWITVEPDTFEVNLTLKEDAIAQFLTSWQEDLGETRALAVPPDLDEMIENWQNGLPMITTIVHNPTTYDVQPGDSLWSISLDLGMPMWYIMDANEGLTSDTLESGMTITIPSRNVTLPLPVVMGKRILIDISEQRMYVYEDGEQIAAYIISTGVEDSPTMAGIFQIQSHEINAYASNWDLYMPHFMGIYEAWPGFMNGIHGLPLLSSGARLWGGNLGTPISYGCIILGLDEAETLYYWAEEGVVVEITQ